MLTTNPLVLYDPVGEPEVRLAKARRSLAELRGKAVGFLFNRHMSSVVFWKHLERSVEEMYEPSRVVRSSKPNTWAPAPRPTIEELSTKTDFTLVGVGA